MVQTLDKAPRKSPTANGTPPKRRESNTTLTRNEFVANLMFSRAQMIKNALSHKIDINKECGYPDDITPEDYKAMYDREGIAQKVVHVFPQESWALDPEIYETEDTNFTPFEEAWSALEKKLNVFHYLQRVDEQSGVGRFGILLLGISDGKQLNQPVEGVGPDGRKANPNPLTKNLTGQKPLEVMFLRVFDESLVQVKELETDPTSPRYGQPRMYEVSFINVTSANAVNGVVQLKEEKKDVHWHRVIHVADNRTTSEVFGVPRMQAVFNRLLDLRKLYGGSAEMFWKGGFPGLALEANPDLEDELDKTDIREQMENYQAGLQRYLAMLGVQVKSLTPQVADPTQHLNGQLQNIALTIGVPMRVFIGSEEAKLASSQDKVTWNGRLIHRQKRYITPMILLPFLERCIAIGALPEPDDILVYWPNLNTLSDEDVAAVAQKLTQACQAYVTGNVSSLIPPLQFFTNFLRLPLDVAQKILDDAIANVELGDDEDDPEGRVGKPPAEPDPIEVATETAKAKAQYAPKPAAAPRTAKPRGSTRGKGKPR